ncbi:MAG: phenylalanyl-tRNA synthetase beta chain, partial [Gammaproteobacteria bacterium]
ALAGIMGGMSTGVSASTTNIFLESAFFAPLELIGQARLYGLHTDASHRYERGVDPELQRRAAERATRLLIDIVGGEPGPIVDEVSAMHMPRRVELQLRAERLARLLGIVPDPDTVTDSLERLGMVVKKTGECWRVTPPSYRFDITIEADLIEEVARMIGYDAVPSVSLSSVGISSSAPEASVGLALVRRTLVEMGYHEAVTYSFVDPQMQHLVEPETTPIALANPISSELAVMRTSMWPGLIQALVYNVNRQQERVRLFETGLTFNRRNGQDSGHGFNQVGDLTQVKCLAGIVNGSLLPEQWGSETRDVDFFDVKGDLERLLALAGGSGEVGFVASTHSALHPGQSAAITCAERTVGYLGAMAPRILQALKLNGPVFLFQIELEILQRSTVPQYQSVSKFPAVRRDIAVVVDDSVAAESIRKCIGQIAPDVLSNLEFFDVYHGEGVDPGKKSIALGLTFQAVSRTLHDIEIDDFVAAIVKRLHDEVGGVLRG